VVIYWLYVAVTAGLAYGRVDCLSHRWADCLYTGISSGPNTRQQVWEAFIFCTDFIAIIVAKQG